VGLGLGLRVGVGVGGLGIRLGCSGGLGWVVKSINTHITTNKAIQAPRDKPRGQRSTQRHTAAGGGAMEAPRLNVLLPITAGSRPSCACYCCRGTTGSAAPLKKPRKETQSKNAHREQLLGPASPLVFAQPCVCRFGLDRGAVVAPARFGADAALRPGGVGLGFGGGWGLTGRGMRKRGWGARERTGVHQIRSDQFH